MKKIVFFFGVIFCVIAVAFSQTPQLQIHQVNIGNGDCTIIAIVDGNGAVVTKSIIDGGNSNYTQDLLPYINQQFGGNTNFRYMILSHFHADHYNGLLVVNNGTIRPDTIIDGGNYNVRAGGHNAGLNPPNQAFPPPKPTDKWIKAVSDYGNNVNNNARRPIRVTNFPAQIGDSIILGSINGYNVTLTLIAANGSNIGPGGFVVDNVNKGRNNQNNYSLGWLLRFGEFRYYTAGDIGGFSANYTQTIPNGTGGTIDVDAHCSSYTNQETSMTAGLAVLLPTAKPYLGTANVAGHVCAAKISHHGSSCSNNTTWLNSLRASSFFLSSGGNKRWKLPKLNTIYNLSLTQSLSDNGDPEYGIFNQGFFFTNMYNFNNQANLTYANLFFTHRAKTLYKYGNDNGNTKGSYMLVVTGNNVSWAGEYAVWRVNCPFSLPHGIPQRLFLGRFQCHSR